MTAQTDELVPAHPDAVVGVGSDAVAGVGAAAIAGGAEATAHPANDARASRMRRFWPLALPAAVMLVLGLWGLDRGTMFGTEAATFWAARLPIGTFWRLLSHVDAVHGLYYLMMRGVLAAGTDEVVLRIPSVIGACAAALLLTFIGYRLTGSRTIAVASGGVLVSLTVVNGTAQEGRSYAIDLALVLAASAALIVAVQRDRTGTGSRTNWFVYGALLVVAGYMHELAILAVAAHAVTLIWSRSDRRLWRRFGVAVGCALVALVPLLVISHAEDAALSWVQRATPRTFVDLAVNLLGPLPLSVAVGGVLVVVGMLPLARFAIPSRSAPLTITSFALPLLVIPGGLLILESMVALPLYGGVRYVLYSTAGAALLAAAGCYRLAGLAGLACRGLRARPRLRVWVRTATVAVLVACVFLAGLPLQLSQRTAQGQLQNLSAASAFVGANARPGDGVLYVPLSAGLAQLGYPDDFRDVVDIALVQTPEQSAEFYGVAATRSTILARIQHADRLWVLGSMTSSVNVSPRPAMERKAIEASFHRVAERDYAGIDVYLYVHD
jgi:Predicted membrane protein